jgi:hypothetical protein
MKREKLVLMVFVAFMVLSCNVDKCDVLCNSGPLGLNFELLDKTTGENLFTNGTFDPADIVVLDLDNNNNSVQFTFNNENDINTINLGPFGWGTNIANYALKVGETTIFTLHVDAEKIEEECCSRVVLNKLTIYGADYSQNPETGIYEVLVEL